MRGGMSGRPAHDVPGKHDPDAELNGPPMRTVPALATRARRQRARFKARGRELGERVLLRRLSRKSCSQRRSEALWERAVGVLTPDTAGRVSADLRRIDL